MTSNCTGIRIFLVIACIVTFCGVLAIPAAAQEELLEFWNLPVNIGQPKPGHLMDTGDWIDNARDCEKRCNELASLVRKGSYTNASGGEVNLNTADMHYYEKQRDEVCNCAKKNYLMAIRACPNDDLRWQANLWEQVSYFEIQMGNIEDGAKYANFARQLRQAAAQKVPLPSWIAVLGIFLAVILAGGRRRGGP